MRGASRAAVTCAVAVLMQACAGGMETDRASSLSSTSSASGGASTPSYGIYGVDSYFKVEWQPDERRGKPMVSGYVTNQWGLATRNVRVRVEALDAAGNVRANYIGYVNGVVPPGSRVYFEVPVEAKAPSYRVTVLSFDPIQGFG